MSTEDSARQMYAACITQLRVILDHGLVSLCPSHGPTGRDRKEFGHRVEEAIATYRDQPAKKI